MLQSKEEGKTIAIISYITVIGLLIAYLMNNDKKNEFAKFHIGQAVRVYVLAFANFILSFFLPSSLWFLSTIISLGVLALLIFGIINAVNLQEKPLPLIGTIGA